MSSEEIQEIKEIPEIPQEIPEIPQEVPEIQGKKEECRDVAPVVPKRGRGRPKGAKTTKVTLLTVDTDVPKVSLNEEPVTLHEDPVAPTKKPRATRQKRVQPPPDPPPERHAPEHVPEHDESGATTMHPMAHMMMSLRALQRERMEARKALYRNMIA